MNIFNVDDSHIRIPVASIRQHRIIIVGFAAAQCAAMMSLFRCEHKSSRSARQAMPTPRQPPSIAFEANIEYCMAYTQTDLDNISLISWPCCTNKQSMEISSVRQSTNWDSCLSMFSVCNRCFNLFQAYFDSSVASDAKVTQLLTRAIDWF